MDLLHYLHEFSLHTLAHSLSLPFADGGGAFIRLCEPIFFALAHENGIRGAAPRDDYRLILLQNDHSILQYVLSIHGMLMCARFLSDAFRVASFRAGSQERSARSVASLALRRSPSYKTRSAGYTTRSHSYLADEGRKRREEKEGQRN